ncbi:uncharacterized protein LOC106074257 [Biomphalaria glabrata]|uniref:Uncharacterized protein LOC106074257 n=1 Tax=Biomphalaria glabrata TaxID=6526 RepID=A0A9W2Z4W2_BIOGL|nr:uncharacterized protein LOC106074257 [Biomphalaria glabrata]XP_055870125.1 uncharacterized protein LOC106074257 [Biomphalaria glabrata]XP_055870126.1 uncharacterized protein LOC106074257 [Biomphalaria glabrata]XP_055870127.1 uncharacterized protein LOC106074257 [Biomphalaria glabrata]XP_055870128.1 uncharacterized protein LOC106074257 [Biomphalaria glabrata]XP_055870129.1 uncharacterized protein LOC106074257 [Biomphalaria glabrata]
MTNTQSLKGLLETYFLCFYVLIFKPASSLEVSTARCSSGQLLNPNGICQPCPANTYMREHNHTSDLCMECPSKNGLKVTIHCNATNLEIRCDPGYFNLNGDQPNCQACKTCFAWQYLVVDCGLNHDAMCCNRSMSYNETSRQCENHSASSTIGTESTTSSLTSSSSVGFKSESLNESSQSIKKISSGLGTESILCLVVILLMFTIGMSFIVVLFRSARSQNRRLPSNNIPLENIPPRRDTYRKVSSSSQHV